jgi:hypothetical protein
METIPPVWFSARKLTTIGPSDGSTSCQPLSSTLMSPASVAAYSLPLAPGKMLGPPLVINAPGCGILLRTLPSKPPNCGPHSTASPTALLAIERTVQSEGTSRNPSLPPTNSFRLLAMAIRPSGSAEIDSKTARGGNPGETL